MFIPSRFWTTCTNFGTCYQRYVATCGKKLYRCTSTFSALNYCCGIFFKSLSIRRGAHKLFRRFLDFSQFLTEISRKLWRHLATEIKTVAVLKGQSLPKKGLKRNENLPINSDTIAVQSISHSSERPARLGVLQTNKQKTNTTFSHLQPARVVRSSPNFAWRYSHQKGVNHFLIQRIVFPIQGARKSSA